MNIMYQNLHHSEIRICRVTYDEDDLSEDMQFKFEIEGERYLIYIAMDDYIRHGKAEAYRRAYHEAVEILICKNKKDFS